MQLAITFTLNCRSATDGALSARWPACPVQCASSTSRTFRTVPASVASSVVERVNYCTSLSCPKLVPSPRSTYGALFRGSVHELVFSPVVCRYTLLLVCHFDFSCWASLDQSLDVCCLHVDVHSLVESLLFMLYSHLLCFVYHWLGAFAIAGRPPCIHTHIDTYKQRQMA